MSPKYILPLNESGASLETVGGKGMSLAKLSNAGLPVPDGFHITTEAYRQFVSDNKLQDGIQAALQDVDVAQPATLERASKTIGVLFAQAPIPGDLANAIVSAYAALPGGNPHVAVRSSATAEDLPEASFAGQQDTYLNISGADQVLEATRKCWASLWTAPRHWLPRPAEDRHARRSAGGGGAAAGERRSSGHPVHRQPVERQARRDGDQRGLGSGRSRGRWSGDARYCDG